MKRPLSDKRPIGPFADLTPKSGEFEDYEIQMVMDGLTRMLKEKVNALEEAEEEYMPDIEPEDIANELMFKRGSMDSAAQKLAKMYQDGNRVRPDSFAEYQKLAKRRDELVDNY